MGAVRWSCPEVTATVRGGGREILWAIMKPAIPSTSANAAPDTSPANSGRPGPYVVAGEDEVVGPGGSVAATGGNEGPTGGSATSQWAGGGAIADL
jgi:hypothetical protein